MKDGIHYYMKMWSLINMVMMACHYAASCQSKIHLLVNHSSSMSHVNLNPSLPFLRAHYVLKQILICPHILSCHTFITYNLNETKKLWDHHFGLCCTSVSDIKTCRVQLVAESYAMHFSPYVQ